MKTENYLFHDVSVDGGVAVARMRHPDYSHDERVDWDQLIDEVAADPGIHVLVVTGWGNPKQGPAPGLFDDFDAYTYYERARVSPMPAFLALDKPVIMALDGSPGVMTIPLAGDILIAERHVTFADTHVLIGTASATQPYLWPLNSGLLRAKKYILTGQSFGAEEAQALGLVTDVVDTGASLDAAMEYARHLAGLRPETLQATKRALNQWLQLFRASVFESALAIEFMTFPKDFADRFKTQPTTADTGSTGGGSTAPPGTTG